MNNQIIKYPIYYNSEIYEARFETITEKKYNTEEDGSIDEYSIHYVSYVLIRLYKVHLYKNIFGKEKKKYVDFYTYPKKYDTNLINSVDSYVKEINKAFLGYEDYLKKQSSIKHIESLHNEIAMKKLNELETWDGEIQKINLSRVYDIKDIKE